MIPDILQLWPDYQPTRLHELPELARRFDVARVLVKAENERPLGNFKVLGGMVAGLRALAKAIGVNTVSQLLAQTRHGNHLPQLICASDGNHGLAVAAAAQRVGTRAVIYLPTSVSIERAARIEQMDGEIVWVNGSYDEAVSAAAAASHMGLLIADTSSDPDDPVVSDVMAGYRLITEELTVQLREEKQSRPSHVFVQAGVGGLAAAMAEGLQSSLRAPAKIVVVEPSTAACVACALQSGRPVQVEGSLLTAAEMLSCGLASAPALAVLQRYHVKCVSVDDDDLHDAVRTLHEVGGPNTTPSGAAGLAGLLRVAPSHSLRAELQLDASSEVLLVVTERR